MLPKLELHRVSSMEDLIRRRDGHQEEVEEEQDKEVERRVRRDAQRTTHRCACMDDME